MAKDVTLLIKLNDQASRKLDKITGNTKKLERANNSAQNSIRKINSGIRSTGRAADSASKGVNKLGKAIRGLAAGFGAFQAGRFVIFKTAELERQTKSLEVLTGSLGNARNIIKELQDFGRVTPFTSSELIETAKRLKAFGFETEQVVDVTKRLADVAGATGADLGGIATAFGQIQAKGRLQGEELLQLQERGVNLQDELQKMYGMTADEFRKALEKGRFSADAVNLALQKLTEAGGKYADGAIAQSDTLAGKFSTLVDNITVLAQHIGDALTPALKGILSLTNKILSGFNDILSSQVARGVASTKLAMLTPGGTMGDIAQMRANVSAIPTSTLRDEASIQESARRLTDIANFLTEFGAAIQTRRPGGTTAEEGAALESLQGLIQDQLAILGQRQLQIAAEDKPVTVKPPKLLGGTGGGTGKTPLQQQQEAAEKLTKSLENQRVLATAMTEDERAMLQLKIDKAAIDEKFPLLAEATRDKLKEQLETLHGQEQVTDALLTAEEKRKKAAEAAAKKAQEDAKKLKEFHEQIGSTIQAGLVNGIQDAITGAKSLKESFSGLLKQLGGMFLNAGIGGLGKSLGIPGFGMAEGGYVSGPTPALVGEGGEPEYVIPSSKMNEAMGRYARGARGGAVIPDGPGGNASGGMTGGGGSIDVSYSVERINNVNYVTAAEFERGMAQAAKRGAELGRRNVYSDLVNKRSVRSKVGV